MIKELTEKIKQPAVEVLLPDLGDLLKEKLALLREANFGTKSRTIVVFTPTLGRLLQKRTLTSLVRRFTKSKPVKPAHVGCIQIQSL